MQWGLAGKTAFVTGAGGGIGQAVTRRLAEQGVAVAVVDLVPARADGVAAEIESSGGRAQSFSADVADPGQVADAVARARDALGPIDYLVNLAGFFHGAAIQDVTDSQWSRMLSVHLGGTFYCCRAVIPEMISHGFGRIVNIASIQAFGAGFPYLPFSVHYAAAKAGIIGLTKALAREVAPQNVLVNVVAPTAVDTPLWRGPSSGAELEARIAERVKVIPVGRLGHPADVADAILFLLSPAASYLTGVVVNLTGGELMV